MSTRSLAEIRAHLSEICLEIATSGEPVEIQCEGAPNILMVPMPSERKAQRMERLKSKPEYISELKESAERARSGDTLSIEMSDLKKMFGQKAASKRPLAEVQAHLSEICWEVAATGEAVEIQCEGFPNALIVPAEDKSADEEMTRKIMGSPENAKRLRELVEKARTGEGMITMTTDELCKSVGLHGNQV